MAVRFDSFSLNDLVAKPDDAFRLCSLAMASGQRVQGYSGDYFRMYLGDTMVVVRTMLDSSLSGTDNYPQSMTPDGILGITDLNLLQEILENEK